MRMVRDHPVPDDRRPPLGSSGFRGAWVTTADVHVVPLYDEFSAFCSSPSFFDRLDDVILHRGDGLLHWPHRETVLALAFDAEVRSFS